MFYDCSMALAASQHMQKLWLLQQPKEGRGCGRASARSWPSCRSTACRSLLRTLALGLCSSPWMAPASFVRRFFCKSHTTECVRHCSCRGVGGSARLRRFQRCAYRMFLTAFGPFTAHTGHTVSAALRAAAQGRSNPRTPPGWP